MPTYVPYFTVVKEPGKQFLREFGSNAPMGNRDMESGEFGREAQTNWSLYLECVKQSLGHDFYHAAPITPHWVVSPTGERKYLEDTTQIDKFYNDLSDAEKEKIMRGKGPLAGLVSIVEQLSLNL